MTVFERVRDYVASFDPAFPDAIQGATAEQVEELETLIDSELPEIYRDFLAVMGRDMDWIAIGKVDFRIEAVLEYYRRENWLPTYKYIRIGEALEQPFFSPHLVSEYYSEADLEVVCLPPYTRETFQAINSQHRTPFAGSLQEMVCLPVFRMYELITSNRRPARLLTGDWRKGAIEDAEALAGAEGFEKCWFSSTTGRAYRRLGAAIQAIQFGGYPLELRIGADDPSEQARMVRSFSERLGISG